MTDGLAGRILPLRNLLVPWAVGGGWAIDLYLGRQTRPHGDVDIVVDRADQRNIRTGLPGWDFSVAEAGRLRPWAGGEWLLLPRHELHAAKGGEAPLEFLLNEFENGVWRYRRCAAVRLARAACFHRSRNGLVGIAPEIALLYKSPRPGARDEQDFAAVVPHLPPASRRWLAGAIRRAHPGSPWLRRLA